MFQGNWIDLIIVIFILLYILEGYARGGIVLIFELIAFVSGFLGALKLYSFGAALLGQYFTLPAGIANAISFLFFGLILQQIISILLDIAYRKIPQTAREHPINQLLSIPPLVVNALIIVAFLLSLALALPLRSDYKQAISDSSIGEYILSYTQKAEKWVGNIFGEALADTFNFITIEPVSHEQVTLHFTQHDLTIDEVAEREMVARVNKERRDRGLSELIVNEKLRDLARVYARDMFERGYFSHYNPEGQSPFDRMEEAGITYRTAGENLALAPNITIAHEGLMDSPGHRENILSPDFGHVGIGVIDGGIYGKMWVQEFTN